MTALTELLQRHLDDGTAPGVIALLGAEDPEIVSLGVAGPDGRPLRSDAIVRLRSMTKIITAVAALRLVERGRLDLDQSVVEWLPELADRRVLTNPIADLDSTVAARREITLRHLLTSTSGYGMIMTESPLQEAMAANGLEAGVALHIGADEWLARLGELPLVFQPGEGWRYHHSFAVLGVLLSRVVGRPLHDHLVDDLLAPLGMIDTGFWVPEEKAKRLAAAYRRTGDGLVETEPAGVGGCVGPPSRDPSHGDLVSTVRDYRLFLQMLQDGGRRDGVQVVGPELVRQLGSDQVPAEAKTPDSFFPGFWDEMSWGWGVGVFTAERQRGRLGWSGGQGTNFWVRPRRDRGHLADPGGGRRADRLSHRRLPGAAARRGLMAIGWSSPVCSTGEPLRSRPLRRPWCMRCADAGRGAGGARLASRGTPGRSERSARLVR